MTIPCRQLRARGNWAEDARGLGCDFPIAWRNTWSNGAYALAGLWLVLTLTEPTRWVMAGALLLLAAGSALYHGFKTIRANNLDWLGMYACMTVLVVHGLFPRAPGLWLGAISIPLVMSVMWAFEREHFDWHMAVLFFLAALGPLVRGAMGPTFLAVILFALGYLCWQLDQHRKIVGLWGHAAWHVLTAAAMAALFAAQAP